MRTVYLDQQIVIESFDGGEIAAAIEHGKSKGIIFPYSPAHIEEIAKAHHHHKREDALLQIPKLEELSGGWAIMARRRGPAQLCQEDIDACLARVQDDGGRLLTVEAVASETERVAAYFENVSDADRNKVWRSVEGCTSREIFSNPHIHKYIAILAREQHFRIRVETFKKREASFEHLFNILNAFGFQKEHAHKRIEHRVHDVSHAIYGSYADLFVTNDGSLRKSSEAIYSLTGMKSKIVDRKGFLELARSWNA